MQKGNLRQVFRYAELLLVSIGRPALFNSLLFLCQSISCIDQLLFKDSLWGLWFFLKQLVICLSLNTSGLGEACRIGASRYPGSFNLTSSASRMFAFSSYFSFMVSRWPLHLHVSYLQSNPRDGSWSRMGQCLYWERSPGELRRLVLTSNSLQLCHVATLRESCQALIWGSSQSKTMRSGAVGRAVVSSEGPPPRVSPRSFPGVCKF